MKCLRIIIALAASAQSYASDNGAIIDGPNYAYVIAAPKGWKLTSTKQLQAAFYPASASPDASFDKSPVVMYVRPGDKKKLGVSNITELNQLDLKGIQQQHPAATSKKVGVVKSKSGNEYPIYSFSGGGYSELVAYDDQPKTITVFVLSADTEGQLQAARRAFEELLESYRALDQRTSLKKSKPQGAAK